MKDEYHVLVVTTEVTNMEMFGNSFYKNEILDWGNATDEEMVAYVDKYRQRNYCCECLDHELGECIEERQRQQFGKQLIHAVARETGVYRQGTL